MIKSTSFNSNTNSMISSVVTNRQDLNKISDLRVTPLYAQPFELGREMEHPHNYEALIQAYKNWVYVCSCKNSNTVANCVLKLYVGKESKKQKILVKTKSLSIKEQDRLFALPSNQRITRKAVELEEVTEHPFLDLIESVNPLLNRFDLWDLTELWLELTGNSYWYVYVNEKLGIPTEIWPMNPQFVKIVVSKDPKKLIDKYTYRRNTQRLDFNYDEVIHFKFSSPQGAGLYGVGPLLPAFSSYQNDQSIRNFETSLMDNMGRPDGVLKTTQRLTEPQWNRLDETWRRRYGGAKKVGKTLILEAGLDYQPITFTPREMNYVVGRKMTREEIAASFGVPMSKLTSDNINLANAYVGELQYMRDAIEPRLRRIEEKLNERLMPMYDDNIFVAYESSIPADRDFELKERESNLRLYVTSVNQERTKMGEKDVEWGDVPLAPMGIAPLGSAPAGGGMDLQSLLNGMGGDTGGKVDNIGGNPKPEDRPKPKPTPESEAGGTRAGEEGDKKKEIPSAVVEGIVKSIIAQLKPDRRRTSVQ